MARIWQLQEAERRFGEVVNAALADGPQIIARHGEEVVVVLSMAEYRKSQKLELPLGEFFQQSPLAGAEELELERDKSFLGPSTIEEVVARIAAAGPSPSAYIPPKSAPADKVERVLKEETIDSAAWDREWATIEAEIKAMDRADAAADERT